MPKRIIYSVSKLPELLCAPQTNRIERW